MLIVTVTTAPVGARGKLDKTPISLFVVAALMAVLGATLLGLRGFQSTRQVVLYRFVDSLVGCFEHLDARGLQFGMGTRSDGPDGDGIDAFSLE